MNWYNHIVLKIPDAWYYRVGSGIKSSEILAQAMVEPTRRARGYQAVGRKLLMVDELPQGAYARYEKDVRATAHVI